MLILYYPGENSCAIMETLLPVRLTRRKHCAKCIFIQSPQFHEQQPSTYVLKADETIYRGTLHSRLSISRRRAEPGPVCVIVASSGRGRPVSLELCHQRPIPTARIRNFPSRFAISCGSNIGHL